MKKLVPGILLCCLAGSLFAQRTKDIITISGRYGFPESYKDTYTGEATETGSFFNLLAPIKLSENTMWVNSLNHFYFNVKGDNAIPSDIANPTVLNGFILRTGIYKKFDRGRGIQLLVAPRLMTDFNKLNAEHFQFGALFVYEKDFNQDLLMSFGAMYNQELFGPYFVPIVNLEWNLSSKWNISGMLPVYAKVNYKANDKLVVGFSHFGLVTTYYLGDPMYAGDYIERQSIDLSLFGRYNLFGNLYLEARAGRSFGRSYKQFAGDQKVDFSLPLVGFGDERVVKNSLFNDGPILDIRLVFNLPVPEN